MAGFWNQANALFRKSLSYQRRNVKSLLRLILFPIVIFLLFGIAEFAANRKLPKPKIVAEENPPLLQVPRPKFRAVKSNSIPFTDVPDESCRENGNCPAVMLITGENKVLGEGIAKNMFTSPFSLLFENTKDAFEPDTSNSLNFASGFYGTPNRTGVLFRKENLTGVPPFINYHIQLKCSNISLPDKDLANGIECVEGLPLWRKSYSEINDELYKGYYTSNEEHKTNEIMGAFDFLNSGNKSFNVIIGYNSTFKGIEEEHKWKPNVVRVQLAENMAANGYLQHLLGPSTKMILKTVDEMPRRVQGDGAVDIGLLKIIAFTWLILQLFTVMLEALVYEKQQNLRMMMAMHGLSSGPYWMITYIYFLILSTLYMFFYFFAGANLGIKMFTKNSEAVQCAFYFVYINLQISMSFVLAHFFKTVKSASVVGLLMVFGTGLMGSSIINAVIDGSASRFWLIALQLYPGFALSRGMVVLDQYTQGATAAGTFGIQWRDLSDSDNGMREVLIVMSITWMLFLLIAFCLDNFSFKSLLSFPRKPARIGMSPHDNFSSSEPNVFVQMEKQDIAVETQKVEQLQSVPNPFYSTIVYDLKKIYPGTDGNPDKFAVKGAHLALPRGECFGMLGPSGAGKTTFISMMIGLSEPTSGTASIEGLDLRTQMKTIHTIMGVCPQHDLLWECLTAREHLRFYGRLRNLSRSKLKKAVEESLRGVDLLQVGDKPAKAYSGGMKRRLSVAIALIGNPKIVYLDEPSTGLDPATRNKLWEVLQNAKKDKTIILTTHDMEEAGRLSDRIGIFADGCFQCLGSPDELKNRYGGYYNFTITTTHENVENVHDMVKDLCPNAKRTYLLSGTQKFELPKAEIKKSDIFGAVKSAKKRFPVQTWGVTETTLEDVFIKVASEADSSIL